jgi:repressor LexA
VQTRDRVLEFIRSYLGEHGYPPTVREIAIAVGVTSTSTVAHHLNRLEIDGAIHRPAERKARALVVMGE